MSKPDSNNAASVSAVSKREQSGFSFGKLLRTPAMGAFVGMVVVFIIFTIFGYHRNFLTIAGFANWMNFACTVGIVAIPVAFLMITGELDISTGAVLPASAMMLGITVTHYDFPMWLGMVSTLAMAVGIGLINGLLVTRTKVPSFMVTLATRFAVGGRRALCAGMGQGSLRDALLWFPLSHFLVVRFDCRLLVLPAQITLGQLGVCHGWRP